MIVEWLGLVSPIAGDPLSPREEWEVIDAGAIIEANGFRVDDSSGSSSQLQCAEYFSPFLDVTSVELPTPECLPHLDVFDMIGDNLGEAVASMEIEAVQDEVERKLCRQEKLEQPMEEDWLWNFSTIGPGGVLGGDAFGLLITLLTVCIYLCCRCFFNTEYAVRCLQPSLSFWICVQAFKGCPSPQQILGMVRLSYYVACSQASCAFDALSRKGHGSPVLNTRQKYAKLACLPFLRRAAILVSHNIKCGCVCYLAQCQNCPSHTGSCILQVQILTCKPVDKDERYPGHADFFFRSSYLLVWSPVSTGEVACGDSLCC